MLATSLREALSCLADETPRLYNDIVAAVGERRIGLKTDREDFCVRVVRGRLDVVADRRGADVQAVTSDGALLALLDGDLDVLDAVWTDRVQLIGDIETLAGLDDALRIFLNASVRAPGMPAVLDRYRDDVQGRAPAGEMA